MMSGLYERDGPPSMSPTPKKCPKCGSELPLEEGWDSMIYHCKPCHIVIDADTGEACEIVILETLYERGHEEKVGGEKDEE